MSEATNYNDEPVQNADLFYKNEDGTPDFTRELPTGLPAGVNLHEAALTRPHTVEKMISEQGEEARAAAAEKSAIDTERGLSTMIPDATKGPDALKDVDPKVISNSTDEIQPNTDINPEAHTADAHTGTETLDDDSAKASEEAAKAKSETTGEPVMKVEIVEKTAEQKAEVKKPAAKTAKKK